MKKITVLLLMLIFCTLGTTNVFAKSSRLQDNANLLNAQEEAELNKYLDEISEELEHDIVVVFEEYIEGSYGTYAYQYYRDNNFGYGKHNSGCILLYSPNSRVSAPISRDFTILFLGEYANRVDDDSISKDCDAHFTNAKKNYVETIKCYAESVKKHIQKAEDEIKAEQQKDTSLFALILIVIIVIFLIMCKLFSFAALSPIGKLEHYKDKLTKGKITSDVYNQKKEKYFRLMKPQQAFKFLQSEFQSGDISEEEYKAQKAAIIANL